MVADFDKSGALLVSRTNAPIQGAAGIEYFMPARATDGLAATFMNLYDLDGQTTLVGFGCLAGQVKQTSAENPRAVRMADTFKTLNLASSSAEQTIWTPASGRKFRLLGLHLMLGAAVTLTFRDNTAGATVLIVAGGTTVPVQLFLGGFGILSAVANNVLTVQASAAATIVGTVYGVEE